MYQYILKTHWHLQQNYNNISHTPSSTLLLDRVYLKWSMRCKNITCEN